MKARTKKVLAAEELPEFAASIENMPEESKIFVDKSVEIAHYIFQLMEQKGMKQKDLAAKLGKSEAEVSKWLAGMHNYTLRSIAKLEAALGAAIICTPPKVFHYMIKERHSASIDQENLAVHVSYSPLQYYKQGKVVCMNNIPNNKMEAAV